MPNLYIIAGCNGAGKTTASRVLLPEVFECREFVNADIIAAQLAPGNPESVALEAGRIMLTRINTLIETGDDFALETTLATKSYTGFIERAKQKGYFIFLIFYWLPSPGFAMWRVQKRVEEGGHYIPDDIIERRYFRGVINLLKLYIPISDKWIIYGSNFQDLELVAEGFSGGEITVVNPYLYNILQIQTISYGA